MTATAHPDLAPIAQLYDDSLEKHGVASQAVGWRDDDGHRLRFAKLASVIDEGRNLTVADLGCGYAAFAAYLLETGVSLGQFIGYDISEAMLAQARRKVPGGTFRHGSAIDRPVDFAFACGIFNVRLGIDDASWRDHIQRTLDNMSAFASRGFAFNLLSTYVDFRELHLYYGDPCDYFDLCKRRYGKRVSLLHDYPLYEWTITVRK